MSKSLTVTAQYVLIVVGMSLGVVSTTPGEMHAQNLGDNVDSGRALARAWCAECHRVEKGRFGIFAADFAEVANLPSTTALSLRVFLQSNHKEMPNFSLKPAEVDDIIAYILSLKRQ
jgi:mono/diheme cytochrome c family protein